MFDAIRNKLVPFIIMALFAIMGAMLPEIFGDQVKAMCEQYLGQYYPFILVTFFLFLFILTAYLKPELAGRLFQQSPQKGTLRFHIAGTDANRRLLQEAKDAIREAETDHTLNILSKLQSKRLEEEISILKARLGQFRQKQRQGVLSEDNQAKTENKISRDILSLIGVLDQELSESYKYYESIKATLRERYEKRLSQKLSRRQPVNLRLLPSTTGSSRQAAESFVPYNENEVPEKLIEYFEKSKGRLLLIGAPGAGKTTLLLQLVLELLEKGTTALPVVLNLARWSNNFPTLEAWIQEILPSEMGLSISKKAAAEIVAQNRLILLLDGFDEVAQEYRGDCLEAIGNYGVEPGRRYVISSRINEYRKIKKSAPVNSQIEVGPLDIAQLEYQLEKADIDKQPESRRLLVAIREDKLLRSIAATPFYFNTLQLLFAKGKHYNEFNFHSSTIEGRQLEVIECFIDEELKTIHGRKYTPHQARKFMAFFAFELSRHNLVDFELTDLQYDWFEWTENEIMPGKFIEGWVRSTALTLPVGLIIGIYRFLAFTLLTEMIALSFFHGLIASIISYMILSIVMGLIFALKKGVSKGLIVGIILANTFGLYFNFIYSWHPILSTSVFLILGLFIGMGHGIIRPPIIFIKDNIRYSLKSISHRFKIIFRLSFFIGLFFGIIVGLFAGLFEGIILGLFFSINLATIFVLSEVMSSKYYPPIIQINTPYQRFKSATKALHFSILQHWHLLYLLSKKDLLPKKLIPFLNDMVEYNLLETDGASWRFRHRILQDYFAARWRGFEDMKFSESHSRNDKQK